MMRMIVILLVAASVVACSPEVWRKAGASQQDANAAAGACESAAQRSRENSNYVYGGLISYNYFNNCMVARGYQVSIY